MDEEIGVSLQNIPSFKSLTVKAGYKEQFSHVSQVRADNKWMQNLSFQAQVAVPPSLMPVENIYPHNNCVKQAEKPHLLHS